MNLFLDIESVLDTTVPEDIIVAAREKHDKQFDFLPEYHKILCISAGYMDSKGEITTCVLTGDEKQIIIDFYAMVKTNTLVGFNILGFDIPFIVKRGMHHGLAVPNALKTYGRKPWELTGIIDLYVVYKMTGYNSASMDAVCKFLGLKSSKDEGIDGSLVQKYHDEGKDEEIYEYCKRDVVSTIAIHEQFKLLNFI